MLPAEPPPPSSDRPPTDPDTPELRPASTARLSGTPEFSDPQLRQLGLPHPGFRLALLLSVLLGVIQLVAVISFSLLAAIVFLALTGRPHDLDDFLDGRFSFVLIALGTLTTFLVALGLSALMFRSRMPSLLGWRGMSWLQWVGVLLLVAPLAVLASEVTNCTADLLAWLRFDWLDVLHESGAETFEQFNSQAFVLVFVVGCLLPGLGEEIFFRGVLSRGLIARHGVVAGTLLASFLFGAVHLEPVQATGAFFLGLGLQFVFLVTRSLPAAVVVHTLNNTLAFALLRHADRFPVPGLTPKPDGAIVHTPPLLLLAAAFAVLSLAALMVRTRTSWVLPDGSYWSPGYVSAERPPVELGAQPVSRPPDVWLVAICLLGYAGLIAAMILASQ